jgi:hypothetical protein
MSIKPTELLLMPEELKNRSQVTELKTFSSELKNSESVNKSPNASPRVCFSLFLSLLRFCL